jgi:hypothetical protein
MIRATSETRISPSSNYFNFNFNLLSPKVHSAFCSVVASATLAAVPRVPAWSRRSLAAHRTRFSSFSRAPFNSMKIAPSNPINFQFFFSLSRCRSMQRVKNLINVSKLFMGCCRFLSAMLSCVSPAEANDEFLVPSRVQNKIKLNERQSFSSSSSRHEDGGAQGDTTLCCETSEMAARRNF